MNSTQITVTNADKKPIWIIEDDPGSQFVYREILEHTYSLSFFNTLGKFRSALQTGVVSQPELLIADLRLPDDTFLNFINNPDEKEMLECPFLVVSSIDDLQSLRLCFDQGALDYLTKPFGRAELQVKVEKILGHKTHEEKHAGEIEFDATTMTILSGKKRSPVLTPKELQLMAVLYNAENRCLRRDELTAKVWEGVTVSPKAFDVHLSNLRKKILNIGFEIIYARSLYHLVPLAGTSAD